MDDSMLLTYEDMHSPRRKRLKIGVITVATLFSTGAVTVLPSMSNAAVKPETDRVACAGASGYDSTGTWRFQQLGLLVGQGCKIYSPDNLSVSVTKPPVPGVPTVAPPAVCLPPGVNTLLCDIFTIVNSVCGVEPADCSWLTNTVFSILFGSPVFSSFSDVTLQGTGNLFCGNGTLSGTGYDANGPEPNFVLNWKATFKNGVGTVTGTATSQGNPADDPSDVAGAVKQLSGKILVADGAQVDTPLGIGFGNCTDNSAGQNPTLVLLTYTG